MMVKRYAVQEADDWQVVHKGGFWAVKGGDYDELASVAQEARDLLNDIFIESTDRRWAKQSFDLIKRITDIFERPPDTAAPVDHILNALADDGLSGDEEMDAVIDADNERMMIRSSSRVDCGCYTSIGEEVTIHYCQEHSGKMFESGLPTVRIPNGYVLAYPGCPLSWRVQPEDMPKGWSYPEQPTPPCQHDLQKPDTTVTVTRWNSAECSACGRVWQTATCKHCSGTIHPAMPHEVCDEILKRGQPQ